MLRSRQITRRWPSSCTKHTGTASAHLSICRAYASKSDAESTHLTKDESLQKSTAKPSEEPKPKKKTQAELDQELQMKLAGIAGDGGDAGVEYEDGKPVAMKRSVKSNMFRYI
ncbi:hypothetical protein FB567DRAFT_587085 [Paraphoma chrysanthemicola]|uniref:Uncharacterized protein n=1 Tax=Paraphoma chrysanthemicola TaxID=798071 RepID=A0A8K0RL23_9PLEO|nr:hypothetical protein FB567DRAFT_587085 [Paraphoma chrysanthemicola]